MSVLNEQQDQPTETQHRAAHLKRGVAQAASQLIIQWNRSFDELWGASDVAGVLAELGTDAAEIFYLSQQNVIYLATILTGRRDDDLANIMAKVAALPAFTINQDGTVTLD